MKSNDPMEDLAVDSLTVESDDDSNVNMSSAGSTPVNRSFQSRFGGSTPDIDRDDEDDDIEEGDDDAMDLADGRAIY